MIARFARCPDGFGHLVAAVPVEGVAVDWWRPGRPPAEDLLERVLDGGGAGP